MNKKDAGDVRELLEWVKAKGWEPSHRTSILATAVVIDILANTTDTQHAMACFAHVCAQLIMVIPEWGTATQEECEDNGKSAVH